MKLLSCPLNGLRNISEFTYGGEYHPTPDHQTTSSRDWAEHVFYQDSTAGIVIEWWCQTPSSFWLVAKRNTLTDEVVRTFTPDELYTKSIIQHETKPETTP